MEQTIAEYASAEGISPQRARELARSGAIRARRVGRSWVVQDGQDRAPRTRRPLSAQSQANLIQFLSTRTFAGLTGHAKTRTAKYARELSQSENPARTLRDLFANADRPQGRGGAAVVRAALDGKDAFVKEILEDLLLPENLVTPLMVARKVHDARVLRGLTISAAAEACGLSEDAYRRLETCGVARQGNLTALRVLKALHAPMPSVIHAAAEGADAVEADDMR